MHCRAGRGALFCPFLPDSCPATERTKNYRDEKLSVVSFFSNFRNCFELYELRVLFLSFTPVLAFFAKSIL